MNLLQELPLKRGEIVAFLCEECNEKISIGECGEHRLKTGHRNFEAIYR